MDPSIPPNRFSTYEPEPVKAVPYTGPKPDRVLVQGKPNNRANRRAQRVVNKKNEKLFHKQTLALQMRISREALALVTPAVPHSSTDSSTNYSTDRSPDEPLQTTSEQATATTQPTQEPTL